MIREAIERCIMLGEYMVETGATVRETAAHFSLGKSTVHKDVTLHLKNANPSLYPQVQKILEKNKAERHIRGGEATRIKYQHLHVRETSVDETSRAVP